MDGGSVSGQTFRKTSQRRGDGNLTFVEEFQQAYLGGWERESISGGRNSKSNGTEVGKGRQDWRLKGNKSINFD